MFTAQLSKSVKRNSIHSSNWNKTTVNHMEQKYSVLCFHCHTIKNTNQNHSVEKVQNLMKADNIQYTFMIDFRDSS